MRSLAEDLRSFGEGCRVRRGLSRRWERRALRLMTLVAVSQPFVRRVGVFAVVRAVFRRGPSLIARTAASIARETRTNNRVDPRDSPQAAGRSKFERGD